jgi:hypothetical protein
MFSRVVTTPLIAPTIAPVPMPAIAPMIQLSPTCAMASAADMPDSASVDPTDRSICRAMITKVMPIATIDTSAVCRPIFRKLSTERNQGDAKLNTTSRIANAP